MISFFYILLHYLFLNAGLTQGKDAPIKCSHFSICPLGSFCNFDDGVAGFCDTCDDPDVCDRIGLSNDGIESCVASCKPCSVSGTRCPDGSSCNLMGGTGGFCAACPDPDYCAWLSLPDSDAEICKACEGNTVAYDTRGKCSELHPCERYGYFCDFGSRNDDRSEGLCRKCGQHVDDCHNQDFSDSVVETCSESCGLCPDTYSQLSINGTFYGNSTSRCDNPALLDDASFTGKCIDGMSPYGSSFNNVVGPLVDCGSGLQNCTSSDKAICLIQGGSNTIPEQLQACKNGSGIGAIIYNNGTLNSPEFPKEEVSIPFVTISRRGGDILREIFLGVSTNILVWSKDDECKLRCSDDVPCPNKKFCNFKYEDHGVCESCIEATESQSIERFEDFQCLISSWPTKGKRECSTVCRVENISFKNCKFCPKIKLKTFDSSQGNECSFCPNGEMENENQKVRKYANMPCWFVDLIYQYYQVDQDSTDCKLAQYSSYICGCKKGYLGATTNVKKAILAWLPRISAMVSFFCSLSIVIMIYRKRENLNISRYQILVGHSIFDMVGSVAYAFTTLPIYEEDKVYAANGNKATCRAQGFFHSAWNNICIHEYISCNLLPSSNKV
mmetsp:Transcript_17017/g.38312  ORF Transcript_17017/g.38312 Transcript_17017/m.38312 type:complete len:613 (-) Transcript_17017:953-2791(-)